MGEVVEQRRTKRLCPTNQGQHMRLTMANERLAQLEQISQLIIFQIKNVSKLIGKAWYDLEIARADLRELIEVYEKWEEEIELNPELQD